MAIFFLWTILSLLVGGISSDKTLGFWGGFLLSMLLSPLIGLIICLFYPSKKSVEERIKLGKPNVNVADELEKFSRLKASGDITEDEFQKMKMKLLK